MNSSTIAGVIIVPFLIGMSMSAWEFYDLGEELFEVLAKRAPKYYEQIGRPKYESFNMVRYTRAQRYLSSLNNKRLPDNFPNNAEARQLAMRIGKIGTMQRKICIGVFAALTILTVVSR
jgi:hypothetical protein